MFLRNIRALEAATGIDLIIDDTPEAVILSGFNPVRREVARLALIKLISDGRIHPARIEEVVGKAEGSFEKLGGAFDEKVAEAIKRLGVPSRNEIAKLTKSVEELTVKVDSLKANPPKKAQAKKPQAKKSATSKAK